MDAAERDLIIKKCRENHVSMIGIFGSTARGDSSPSSDVDILVRFAEPTSLLSLVRIERELSDMLGRKVDLLTESSVSPYLKNRIFEDLWVIYGAR